MSRLDKLRLRQLFSFFIPLGLSASLVTISHVVINSTLARSPNPELTIASFAIAMSVFIIAERPAFMLRQTCSALVRDRVSFRSMTKMTLWLIGFVLLFGILVAYTPIGRYMFLTIFGVQESVVNSIIDVYRILMFVTIFSALRCLYQGIIIANLKTKWITIGMVIRLVAMYLLSIYFIQSGMEIDGRTGAIIFMAGMMIEATVCYLEGRLIARKLPERIEEHRVHSMSDIFGFYRPLVYSAFIAVIVPPAINVLLSHTNKIELAIASYALAFSVAQLLVSAFTYMHQMVLTFYEQDRHSVLRFSFLLAFIPTVILAILVFTSAGPFFLTHIMGIEGQLLWATLDAMKVFMILTLVFPWVDFVNGILMLHRQTHIMVYSQTGHVVITLVVLVTGIFLVPHWNGSIGALAQSLGFVVELIIGLLAIYLLKKGGS